MERFAIHFRTSAKEWAGAIDSENIATHPGNEPNEIFMLFLEKLQEMGIIKDGIKIGENFKPFLTIYET